ncbi:hypothetical protein ACHAXR_002820 [Thalassiosira sp. AJA248-18]
MPQPVPWIAMSATFCDVNRKTVTKLLGGMSPTIMSGKLERRRTLFECKICGNPAASLKSSAKCSFIDNPTSQQLHYTNSKTNAQGSLLDSADAMLEGGTNIAHSFTGDDGIMMKSYSMEAFTNYKTEEPSDSDGDSSNVINVDDGNPCPPNPNIQVMTGTSAVNVGISSSSISLTICMHNGLPPNLYDLVQALGRVVRTQTAEPGSNKYEIHISFDRVVSLYIRVMQNEDTAERQNQLVAMFEVLSFLVVPTDCYHSFIEAYFEVEEPLEDKQPCGNFCSYCRGDTQSFTGRFYKSKMQSLLTTTVVSPKPQPKYKSFIQSIKAKKDEIFHPDDVPHKLMGPIHALALQMLAIGIIELHVSDTTKIGTDKLSDSHVLIRVPNATDERGTIMSEHGIHSLWDGMNYES